MRRLAALCALALTASARAGEPESLGPPWREVGPGVHVASAADLGGDPSWAARIVLVDPALARFAVRFDPGKPNIDQWRARFPAALAISNGSFFSSADGRVRPTCDLIAEGKPVKGAGCQRADVLYFGAAARPKPPPDRGSHTALTSSVGRTQPARALLPKAAPRPAEDPRPKLVSAAEFSPGDWTDALKSFPALVHAGYPACTGANYCAEVSRTAALAQLRDGRVLLFASQWPAIRREVARFLVESLGAEEAVNLDGGPEATLAIKGEAAEESVYIRDRGLATTIVVLPKD